MGDLQRVLVFTLHIENQQVGNQILVPLALAKIDIITRRMVKKNND